MTNLKMTVLFITLGSSIFKRDLWEACSATKLFFPSPEKIFSGKALFHRYNLNQLLEGLCHGSNSTGF